MISLWLTRPIIAVLPFSINWFLFFLRKIICGSASFLPFEEQRKIRVLICFLQLLVHFIYVFIQIILIYLISQGLWCWQCSPCKFKYPVTRERANRSNCEYHQLNGATRLLLIFPHLHRSEKLRIDWVDDIFSFHIISFIACSRKLIKDPLWLAFSLEMVHFDEQITCFRSVPWDNFSTIT